MGLQGATDPWGQPAHFNQPLAPLAGPDPGWQHMSPFNEGTGDRDKLPWMQAMSPWYRPCPSMTGPGPSHAGCIPLVQAVLTMSEPSYPR